MAFVTFKPGSKHKAMTVSPQQAIEIKQVMAGELDGTPKQKAFAKTVDKVYMAQETNTEAPQITDPWWNAS